MNKVEKWFLHTDKNIKLNGFGITYFILGTTYMTIFLIKEWIEEMKHADIVTRIVMVCCILFWSIYYLLGLRVLLKRN